MLASWLNVTANTGSLATKITMLVLFLISISGFRKQVDGGCAQGEVNMNLLKIIRH